MVQRSQIYRLAYESLKTVISLMIILNFPLNIESSLKKKPL